MIYELKILEGKVVVDGYEEDGRIRHVKHVWTPDMLRQDIAYLTRIADEAEALQSRIAPLYVHAEAKAPEPLPQAQVTKRPWWS